MGFNSVYRSLQELFPQVDARLLRAVAIEHPKDADLAAGIVLAEVIPFMSKKLPLATPPQDNAQGAPLNVEAESEEEGSSLTHQDIDVGPSSAPHSIYTKSADYSSVLDLNEALDNSTLSNVSNSNGVTEKFLGMDDMKKLDVLQKVKDNFIEEISNKIAMEISNCFIQEGNENIYQRRPHVDVESENLISSGICQETEPEHSYHTKEATSTNNNGNGTGNRLNEEWVDFVGPSADDYNAQVTYRRIVKLTLLR